MSEELDALLFDPALRTYLRDRFVVCLTDCIC
jgi:hypothetical protein